MFKVAMILVYAHRDKYRRPRIEPVTAAWVLYTPVATALSFAESVVCHYGVCTTLIETPFVAHRLLLISRIDCSQTLIKKRSLRLIPMRGGTFSVYFHSHPPYFSDTSLVNISRIHFSTEFFTTWPVLLLKYVAED